MGQYWFSFLFFILADNLIIDEAESVSPPSTPLSVGIRLISASENENLNENSQSSSKRAKKSVENDDFNGGLLTGSVLDGYRFIEKFNRDMMDQFLDYQRRVAASQIRWEQERYRQEQLAIGNIDYHSFKNYTVFENHRKSHIQHCERSELQLHFEWTKVIWILAFFINFFQLKVICLFCPLKM